MPAWQVLVDAVGLIPVVGALKNVDEVAALVKAFRQGENLLGGLTDGARAGSRLALAGAGAAENAGTLNRVSESFDAAADTARGGQRLTETGGIATAAEETTESLISEIESASAVMEETLPKARTFEDLGEDSLEGKKYVEYSGHSGANATEGQPVVLYPTHRPTHSKKSFQQLMESIAEHGIREPIKYVEYKGNCYIVDGHHRFWAARYLGIENIPVQKVSLPYKGYRTPIDLFYD